VDSRIRALAKAAGIATDWIDAADRPQRVSVGSLRSILDALGFPCTTSNQIAESQARLAALSRDARTFFTATVGEPISIGTTVLPAIDEPGYHQLETDGRAITVAVAPPRCLTLDDIAPGEQLYGLAVQLYALRGANDQGIGDAAALRDFVGAAARQGADAVALSPVHSLFAADPSHFGPYSPSSRLFLNPLYADPSMVFDNAASATPSETQDGALIDWPKAARVKLDQLRRLHDGLATSTSGPPVDDFTSFVQAGGERLREHALFEALHQRWLGQSEPKWSWNEWPADWRTPQSTEVKHFAGAEARSVEFHMFLQWVAARSFAEVQASARRAGMRIGLIADLAIGMHPGGSHAWSRQDDLLPDLSVGAPPDLLNGRGQNWGLTAFSPPALVKSGFEPFIATLRAAMQHAGGVRVDHVMGLGRLWLIPRGAAPTEGAYLAYPVDDMLRLLALESHRHRAVVIGEDLGTVEPEFRRRLSTAGIAGLDVLWFQRDGNDFLPPQAWRRDAIAMTTTHDLPTVAGWWSGHDIEMRTRLGFVADETQEKEERAKNCAALWRAFRKAGVVTTSDPPVADTESVVDAAIAFTAQSPARLALVPIEDALGLTEQPNLPGTIDEHPNWRRRLDKPASEILDAPRVRARLKVLRERGP
jgi:4-alpha-glucanotransferase